MNIPVTRAAEGLARRAFTIADLERMAEVGIIGPDERLELLGGEIVPMSPKGSRHEVLKIAIAIHWGGQRPANFVFAPEPGFRLDKYTYLEPDFIVFERSVRFVDLMGADVLLAVEVADSSLSYDLGRKAQIYAAFGVRELWVIDARRRVVHRHREVAPNGYTQISQHGAGERLAPTHAPAAFGFALDELEAI